MLDPPEIVQTSARPAAVIRLTIPREEIRNVMGPAIGEVMAAVRAQGIAPAGRVKPGELPAARVARTVYPGPYEGLGPVWGEFAAWISVQGLVPAPNLRECCLAGPESGPDPAGWRTELNRPLVG